MTKQTSIILAVLFGLIIASVAGLEYAGRDAERLIDFLTVAIIPTVAAIWAGNRAERAERSATQAVHNTNGRMKELIAALRNGGGTVDQELYDDILDDDGAPLDLDDESHDDSDPRG